MSRNTKIVLVIASTLLVSCCLLGVAAALVLPQWFRNAVSSDPQKARQIAAQIADYTLPPGYEEEFGMDVFTTKMVVIDRPDRRGLTIMLMQFSTTGMNREQMEQQMRQSFQSQFQSNTGALTPVGTEMVTIKGQPVVLTISEGTNTHTNAPVRQATGVFQGKGGTAMLMVYGNSADWNKAMLDKFYQSIQ